ncbi:MAG: hypothetical protein BWK80_05395 [Desulfobacteraceae bacterium IS3]|jgi:hypothetical protein|nr:MAG: hypothetical protein BWK80_05395 [Desulfobacteraceae bacterium IS3]HAO21277.1 hypothetical protein [Desulfobacteraceae bacterium]
MDSKIVDMIYDFITGKETPLIGAEENRQRVERFLVEQKGFAKQDIEVDAPLEITLSGEVYRSRIDLIVRANDRRLMAIKCAAGSLGSREREILAAARLTDTYQIPFSMVSDGKTAIVLDTVSGQTIGEGLDAVFSKQDASEKLKTLEFLPFPENKLHREKIIFRSYDSMNVNVSSAA